jgi:hypothetical protein
MTLTAAKNDIDQKGLLTLAGNYFWIISNVFLFSANIPTVYHFIYTTIINTNKLSLLNEHLAREMTEYRKYRLLPLASVCMTWLLMLAVLLLMIADIIVDPSLTFC